MEVILLSQNIKQDKCEDNIDYRPSYLSFPSQNILDSPQGNPTHDYTLPLKTMTRVRVSSPICLQSMPHYPNTKKTHQEREGESQISTTDRVTTDPNRHHHQQQLQAATEPLG